MNTPLFPCTTHLLDPQILIGASSFKELLDHALPILREISLHARSQTLPVIQICAPMTTGGLGNLEANMARFYKAVALAQQKGYIIFNQGPFDTAMARLAEADTAQGRYCHAILEVFYRGIFASGDLHALWFMPGWESSFGCRWEYQVGGEHSLFLADYPQELLEELGL